MTQMSRSTCSGFTLIELMMVVAIAAIMASLGLPSFRSFVEGQRIKTAAGDFAQSALYARSEAIKRNGEVRLIAATGGWGNGWNVTVTNDAVVIATQAAYPGITLAASATEVAYQASGRLGSAATTLTVSGSASTSRRCVSFDLSGMPRSLQGSQCP